MLDLLMIAAAYIFIQMVCVWTVYRLTKNPSIIDVAWGIGLMVSGLIYLWSHAWSSRLMLISLLLIIWGLRLSAYLWYTRIRKGIIDKRYIKLSEQWKMAKSLGFFLNFELQGFFILIISSVFLFAAMTPTNSLQGIDWLGVALVIVGVFGETVADQQLYRFQQHNKGQVCQVGLWYYSRHPNYFFEWLVWCGFSLFGLSHPLGCLSLISPLLLYFIMTKITGRMTEQGSIASRGEAYLIYQRQTPMFFPFKKLLKFK